MLKVTSGELLKAFDQENGAWSDIWFRKGTLGSVCKLD